MSALEAADAFRVKSVELIENGWFIEKNSQWPGVANAIQVEQIVEQRDTEFQDVLVFESKTCGKVLVLDGVIQLTEKDEMSYQEMMAHLPLFAHEKPEQVLVIGGGDGGVIREVCKHRCVVSIQHCEVDKQVVEISKAHIPTLASSFDDPRLSQAFGDGVEFVERAPDCAYDVVIVDSSDPVGPAEKLYSKEFYANAHRVLKPGGVLCTQGESLWNHADLIAAILETYCRPYASAEYASIQIPTYPSGQIGALLARRAFDMDAGPQSASCRTLRRSIPPEMPLRYYSAEMHSAAFALPAFFLEKVSRREGKTPVAKRCRRLEWHDVQ